MRLTGGDREALYVIALFLGWLMAMHGFIVVAPWIGDVVSVEEAARRCPGDIDPTWPAVFCSHGRPTKWELGLFADNPVRYGLAVAELVIGGTFFIGGLCVAKWRDDRRR